MTTPSRLVRLLPWLALFRAPACAGVQEVGHDTAGAADVRDATPDAPQPQDVWPWEPFPGADADAGSDTLQPASPWTRIAWDTDADWTGVGGSRFDDLFVVGSGGHALVFNGVQFVPVDTGTAADLASADARDGRRVAVGVGGACLESRGGPFTPLALGTAVDLYGVRLLPTGDLYAVGDAGTIRRWTGAEALAEGSNTENRLTAVWGTGPDELTVTGAAGGVLEKLGGQWFRTQVATGADTLNDLDGRVDGPLVAVGDRGLLSRRDDLGWREELSNDLEAHALRGVSVVADDEAWAAGDGGSLLRYTRVEAG